MGKTHLDSLELKDVTAITVADAVVAAGATPTKGEFDAVVTLLNAIKAKINEICKG